MHPKLTCLLSILLVSVLTCTAAWGQATAQITGTVRDQSSAVLPGAEITATQTETGISRNTISNETGSFIMANLALGPYRIEVALPGFRTYVQTGIVLQVNSNPVINAVLEVGQVTETVEVQANAAMVETRSVGIAQIMENERILELPLNGRNVTELVTLTGGAVQSGVPAAMNFDSGRFISVNGGLGFGVQYNLDGAMHTDQYSGLGQPFPFPDALQEFKVETSGLSAQNGGQSGASVNSVTKSGTNEIHGDLFEFLRNDLFNARQPFATTGSTLKRNQFGGTLGGPILKNRLFFFAGYQGTTLREDPSDTRTFIPTAAMLAGDFTTVASTRCRTTPVTLRGNAANGTPLFSGNRTNPANFSKAALNIVSKLPKTEDPCGEIVYGVRNYRNDGQLVGRIDYQTSEKHSIFGRFMSTWYDVKIPYELTNNLLASNQRGFANISHSLTLGSTYLLGPNTVNSFRAAAALTSVTRLGAKIFSAPDVGINIYSYLPKYMVMSITGAFSVGGGTATDSSFDNANIQVSDDVSIIRGAHQMAFGGVLARGYSNGVSNVRSPGSFSFSGQQTGLSLADFLTGKVNSFIQSGPALLLTHRYYVGLYGQDTWKATPRLTFNYGVRWEPYFPQAIDGNTIYNFSLDRFRQGVKSSVFKNAPAGLHYPGDPGFPGNTGNYNSFTTFQPRAGFAWDLHGDGRTSIRASYGIAYNFKPLVWHIDTAIAPPWGNQVQLNSPAGGLDNPWQGVAGGNPFPTVFNTNTPFVERGTFNTNPYDAANTYAGSWNLGIQKQIRSDWLLSTTYTGSQTVHLWTQKALNPGVYIPGGPCTLNGVVYNPCSQTANLNLRRKLYLENPAEGRFIGVISEFDDGGTMSYNGLILNLQRRAARGVTISGNYTWSHCIGDYTDFNGSGPDPGTDYQDPNNRRLDRGNCPSDRRHVFNMTAVAETPRFARNALRALASGWRLSGIYRKASGQYLTVTSGVDQSMTGTNNQRMDRILANPYSDKSGRAGTVFLNPLAFTRPALGAIGNSGRLGVEGLGTWSFDLALSRVLRFAETQRVELRAEAFNVTNSFRPNNPSTNHSQNTFGIIRTADDPRIMQFALKYIF